MNNQADARNEDDAIEVNRYTVNHVFSDEGSIVVFAMTRAVDGSQKLIAVDHRSAQDIVDALARNEPDITCYAEDWQISGAWK